MRKPARFPCSCYRQKSGGLFRSNDGGIEMLVGGFDCRCLSGLSCRSVLPAPRCVGWMSDRARRIFGIRLPEICVAESFPGGLKSLGAEGHLGYNTPRGKRVEMWEIEKGIIAGSASNAQGQCHETNLPPHCFRRARGMYVKSTCHAGVRHLDRQRLRKEVPEGTYVVYGCSLPRQGHQQLQAQVRSEAEGMLRGLSEGRKKPGGLASG